MAEIAVARGDEVTTVNRGETGADVPGVLVRRADRTDQAQLRSALGDDSWDAVVDTWSRPPCVVSESAALHNGNVDAIIAAGLVCRPVEETVADTWRWLQAEGDPPVREGGLKHGLDPDREREVLASLA